MRKRLGIACGLAAALVGAITVQNTLLAASPQRHPAPTTLSWPGTLQGLHVQRENITATLLEDRRALWVDQVSLYTLRRGTELQATLEVARFKPSTPWSSADFEQSLVGQLGTVTPVVTRLGGVRVYITGTRGLSLAAWFHHGYMLVLGIRPTYSSPRDLIRTVLELSP
jgi:hypothetical protein